MRHDYDVVVVGAGPVGLTIANLLGKYGTRTLLMERNATTVSEPRAVSIDDESLRAVQAAGLIEKVIPELMLDYGSDYISPSGHVFARVRPAAREYGYPRRNGFHQPVLEATLREGLSRFSHVDALFDHTVESVSETSNHVSLTATTTGGASVEVRARYLAACDGAASTIRDLVFKQKLQGSTYNQNWIIVDLVSTKNPFHHTEVYCDSSRPGISLPGPKGTRRFEFMMLPGETEEEALDPKNVTEMLAAVGPDKDCKRIRTVIYRFHARIADRWQQGRVTLHGDAAHLTPPFAGQGMNSGIRDAFNYSWKVAMVLRHELDSTLLESYEVERKPHAWDLILMAIRMGRVMMPRNVIQGTLTRLLFWLLGLYRPAKDYIVQMRYKPKPRFKNGFFVPDSMPPSETIIGRMFPQPRVMKSSGEVQLLDELLGDGFALLYLSSHPGKHFLNLRLNTGRVAPRKLCILPQDINFPDTDAIDYVRDYRGALASIFDRYANSVVLLRPDRYVCAAIPINPRTEVLESVEALFSSG